MAVRHHLRSRRPSNRELNARERVLSGWFKPNEIAELSTLPLYRIRKYRILQGRKRHVKDVMSLGLTKAQALDDVYKAFRAAGFTVLVGDYIQAYNIS